MVVFHCNGLILIQEFVVFLTINRDIAFVLRVYLYDRWRRLCICIIASNLKLIKAKASHFYLLQLFLVLLPVFRCLDEFQCLAGFDTQTPFKGDILTLFWRPILWAYLS